MGVPKPPQNPLPPPPFSLEDNPALAAAAAAAAGLQTGLSRHQASMAALGRAPQVRDRSGPRVTNNHPMMTSPGGSMPLPPTLQRGVDKPVDVSTDGDSDMPEQDEALSLVVGPKKKRHKVTDSRITPRAMNRALAGADGALGGASFRGLE